MALVLVSGAAGFVGVALCQALLAAGHDVRPLVRRPEQAARLAAMGAGPAVIGDLGQAIDWPKALAGVEAIVHLAAVVHQMGRHAAGAAEHMRVNLKATEALALAAAGRVARLVFLSTVKVHGESTPPGRPFVESQTPRPQGPYARSKHLAEQALTAIAAQGGFRLVSLRPPLVHGPGVGANFRLLLRAVHGRWPLPLALARAPRSLLYVENLTSAIILALEHPAAEGAYLLRDGQDVGVAELLTRLGLAMGRPARLWPVPLPALGLAARVVGKAEQLRRLTEGLCVDDRRLRHELGWRPPCDLDEGLRRTARWYAGAPERLGRP
ncbi:NAD-dependent epimerase/dehydratase [Desulfarculus baarsii DSM 2075]|uniref:NAD-dependent epimerase/dehydratase n=1 Tax=Desulfarculus baarsii (strain ATCC 33931 / DSM 2075 / LMG 7858 / VKM B-1802 / 2st14) TaxID=644282 RepID=E1QM81_DESB2|nr:NAD-dependent epimerase/dehydratase family protein [Desulfarculus baarsii]ADK86124.1 NAD-dependent epimerase/dehydratase [Desulfarculus baarsii DSM 2075]